jgi:hypothetical protein
MNSSPVQAPKRPPRPTPPTPGHFQLALYHALCAYAAGRCNGLTQDDDALMWVCRVRHEHWAAARNLIFDGKNCFRLIAGRWHHPVMRQEWRRE